MDYLTEDIAATVGMPQSYFNYILSVVLMNVFGYLLHFIDRYSLRVGISITFAFLLNVFHYEIQALPGILMLVSHIVIIRVFPRDVQQKIVFVVMFAIVLG